MNYIKLVLLCALLIDIGCIQATEVKRQHSATASEKKPWTTAYWKQFKKDMIRTYKKSHPTEMEDKELFNIIFTQLENVLDNFYEEYRAKSQRTAHDPSMLQIKITSEWEDFAHILITHYIHDLKERRETAPLQQLEQDMASLHTILQNTKPPKLVQKKRTQKKATPKTSVQKKEGGNGG